MANNTIIKDSAITGVSPSYTITAGTGLGTDGTIWPAGSSTSINWNTPAWPTANDYYISTNGTTGLNVKPSGKISLQGEEADIEINGQSLVGMLKRIEERINILTVNQELESEWEELRELGNQYRELEQRIKDKLETWNKLQAQDKDNR